MGRRWTGLMDWQDSIYSSTTFFAKDQFMSASPLAVLDTVLNIVVPSRRRKALIGDDGVEVTGTEVQEMDNYFEQMILDVNQDIQIIIRNLNPGVSLRDMSWDELAEFILDNPTIRGTIMSKWEAYPMCAEALNDDELAHLQNLNP